MSLLCWIMAAVNYSLDCGLHSAALTQVSIGKVCDVQHQDWQHIGSRGCSDIQWYTWEYQLLPETDMPSVKSAGQRKLGWSQMTAGKPQVVLRDVNRHRVVWWAYSRVWPSVMQKARCSWTQGSNEILVIDQDKTSIYRLQQTGLKRVIFTLTTHRRGLPCCAQHCSCCVVVTDRPECV